MNEYKLLTQRIGLLGITNLLVSLGGIILLPILTKNIPVEDYGVWVQITVTIGLIPAVVMLGLPYTMVRFLAAAKRKEDIQEGFYSIAFIVLLTSAITSFIIFLFSNQLAAALFNNNIIVTKILSLIIFIKCLNNLLLNYFRTFQQIKRYSTFLFMQTYLNVVLVAYFVLSGYGIFGAVTGLLISVLLAFLAMASFIISEIGVRILPKFTNIREYLSFGLPTVSGNLSSWIVSSSDRYVISIFLGTAFVGYYSPGYALGGIINMFIAPLAFMLPAVLSKYYDENNMKEVRTILSYSLKYFLLLAIPSALGLSLLSKPLLTILTTSEIASQGYLVTPFVAISSLLFGAYAIIVQVIVLKKKTKITGTIWVIAAMLNLGLNIIFVPYMGILGAAITTLITYAFAFILTTYYSLKYFTFDIDFMFIVKSVFASLAMVPIIINWNPIGLKELLIEVGICSVVYTAVLLLLGGIKKEEIRFFRNLFLIR